LAGLPIQLASLGKASLAIVAEWFSLSGVANGNTGKCRKQGSKQGNQTLHLLPSQAKQAMGGKGDPNIPSFALENLRGFLHSSDKLSWE